MLFLYSGERRVQAGRETTEKRKYSWHFAKQELMIKASKIISLFPTASERIYQLTGPTGNNFYREFLINGSKG